VKRDFRLEIGKGEGLDAVAAVGCPQQGEQRLVLVDGQELSVAKRPAFGREVEREDADFC
jgi:hypothetical protein